MGKHEELRETVSEGLLAFEEFLERIPGGIGGDVKDRITKLRKLLVEQREPRFALVGRRGSGKSSLINAILGENRATVGHEVASTGRGQWYAYETQHGTMQVLDTRGLQEGSAPDQGDDATTPRESILRELRASCPDAVLFLVKAKEVDAAVDGDLDEVEELLKLALEDHGVAIPILGVITNCDELEPRDVRLHMPSEEQAEELDEKLERVRRIESHLDRKIRTRPSLATRLIDVVGVSSYQSWRADGSRRSDQRWRIDVLVEKLVRELPEDARVEIVRLSQVRHLQRELAMTVVQLVAGLCAAVALAPIPIADLVPITSLQVAMVAGIAYVAGRSSSLKMAAEFLVAMGVNTGVGFAVRELARALVKLVPVAGSVFSAGIAYGTTVALGQAACAYFIDKKSPDEARAEFESARKVERKKYEARKTS